MSVANVHDQKTMEIISINFITILHNKPPTINDAA